MQTVSELRQQLIDAGVEPNEANSIKGKQNLVDALNNLNVTIPDSVDEDKIDQEIEQIFSDANIEHETDTPSVAQPSTSPDMTSPDWQEFALSHLKENEKINGHPKADSLRRLIELLIGKIISIDTEVVQCPDLSNQGRATVVSRIEVDTGGYHTLKAAGSADVCPANTDQVFAKFPVATAETRAEGRAYRKLLRFVNVVTAEELVDESQICDPYDQIDQAQLIMIDTMCSTAKLNINVEKFLELHDVKVENLNKLSKSKALNLCKTINSYQETGVPENLVGYNPNWR